MITGCYMDGIETRKAERKRERERDRENKTQESNDSVGRLKV